VRHFMESVERAGEVDRRAGAFSFKLDSYDRRARVLEGLVALRCAAFGLPYGDQGLLIHSSFYRALGGYRPIPLMEDVDIVRRIGRRGLVMFRAQAVTSPRRYERAGYTRRALTNLSCLAMYYAGVDPARIARRYGA
jgi:hypothetical protein